MPYETSDTTVEIPDKELWAKELPERFSTEFARVMARDGKPVEYQTLTRLYSLLLWKVDWIVDNDPWAGYNPETDGDPEEAHTKYLDMQKSQAFKESYDVSKFGTVMKISPTSQTIYTELVNEAEARFKKDHKAVMMEIDRCISNFLVFNRLLATPEGVEAALQKVPLDRYLEYRKWTGALTPCSGVFWTGEEWSKEEAEETAKAAAALNDIYDYHRDKMENHLILRHYFDTDEEMILFVRDYWYEVRSRIGEESRGWMDRWMVYQQDEEVQAGRGFDRQWYGRLNKHFS